MKTILILLDFKAGRAVRYVGRQATQSGSLVKSPDDPWKMGSKQGLKLLEAFRNGKLQPATVDNREYA